MAKGKKRKQPLAERRPKRDREPVAARDLEFLATKPAWRVRRVQKNAPWSWRDITAKQLELVQERLAGLETMTWREVLNDSKKHFHLVEVANMAAKAQRAIKRLGLAVDELLSIRVQGRERVWGLLDDERGLVDVLWWDPQHEVCPSRKKHT